MTSTQQVITIVLMAFCVVLTRSLPYILFPSKDMTPKFVQFLGEYLGSAVFGMLIIYCLKDVNFTRGNYGFPQLLGILVCVLLHLWRKSMLLTIAGGTVFYMIMIHNL